MALLRRKYLNYRLSRIITDPHPSRQLLLLSLPCQIEVESDPKKIISDDSSSDTEDTVIENLSRVQIWHS